MRVVGATAVLDDGGDVFYADALGLASASATATTASGSGGALNRPVGLETARFEASGEACNEQLCPPRRPRIGVPTGAAPELPPQ